MKYLGKEREHYKGKSPKQYLTNAKDLTLMLPGDGSRLPLT